MMTMNFRMRACLLQACSAGNAKSTLAGVGYGGPKVGRLPMELKGYCHGGSVKFSVQSPHPYPFNLCYCSICRKTAGGGGYAINLSGQEKHHRLPRADARRSDRENHQEHSTPEFLQETRQRAVALGPAVAGAGAPVCFGDRHLS